MVIQPISTRIVELEIHRIKLLQKKTTNSSIHTFAMSYVAVDTSPRWVISLLRYRGKPCSFTQASAALLPFLLNAIQQDFSAFKFKLMLLSKLDNLLIKICKPALDGASNTLSFA